MNITLKAKSPIAHGAYTDGVDTGNIMLLEKCQCSQQKIR